MYGGHQAVGTDELLGEGSGCWRVAGTASLFHREAVDSSICSYSLITSNSMKYRDSRRLAGGALAGVTKGACGCAAFLWGPHAW
jgi:hypothetical protein